MCDAQDAARYRWLTKTARHDDDISPEWADDIITDFFRGRWVHADDLNAAIDAAMEATRYELTDAGRTEADRMRAAMNGKLGGKAKAGEP